MNKIAELKRAKRLALSLLLLIAAATFVITFFLPPNFWVLGIKAIAEAAMVGRAGGLVLPWWRFSPVPIPFISQPHGYYPAQ